MGQKGELRTCECEISTAFVRKESDKEINQTGKFGVGVEHAGVGLNLRGGPNGRSLGNLVPVPVLL